MVDFKFIAESTARTKNLVPRSMTFILHLLSAVVGAGIFIFRKLDLKEICSSANDQDNNI